MTAAVSRLKIDDETLLVGSLIDRCPRTMMLRELVQNGIEAAASAPAGERLVRLFALEVEGGRKLAIWNSGRGMNADELYRMCDIAASIRKTLSLDQNFGMGAKVAALASNTLGVRYRSCNDGKVHEVLLGHREGSYGRVRRPGPDGVPVEVLDVTEQAQVDGGDISRDWTEVVLLGRRREQDTVQNPYDDDPQVGGNWIAETLFQRYFRLPEGVAIRLGHGLHAEDGERIFRPLGARPEGNGALREAVTDTTGVTFHYFYDPPHPERDWEPLSANDELQQNFGLLGLAHRGEMYQTRTGGNWAYGAPVFGIVVSPRNYSVVVELPEDYPVIPDTYRTFLQNVGADQGEVQVDAFAATALSLRPKWLIELQEPSELDFVLTKEFETEIRQLSDSLGLADAKAELPFQLRVLRDEQDIRDRWLIGRAAKYFPDVALLAINARYRSLQELQANLTDDIRARGGRHEAQDIQRIAERAFIRRIVRTLGLCLAKKNNPGEWGKKHIETATSEEALTLAADDLSDLRLALRRDLGAEDA